MKRLLRNIVVCGALALVAASPALGNDGFRNDRNRYDWQQRSFASQYRGHDRDWHNHHEIERQAHYQRPYRPSYQYYRPVAPTGLSTYWSDPRGNTFWFFFGR